jgi:hypothetical protein
MGAGASVNGTSSIGSPDYMFVYCSEDHAVLLPRYYPYDDEELAFYRRYGGMVQAIQRGDRQPGLLRRFQILCSADDNFFAGRSFSSALNIQVDSAGGSVQPRVNHGTCIIRYTSTGRWMWFRIEKNSTYMPQREWERLEYMVREDGVVEATDLNAEYRYRIRQWMRLREARRTGATREFWSDYFAHEP